MIRHPLFRLLSVSIFILSIGFVVRVMAQPPSLEPLRWRYIGPVGNRTTSIVGVPGQPFIYYTGSASGGIFKTVDGGIHWEPIFDAQPVSSIGSLAVAASDPSIVWAGRDWRYPKEGIGFHRSRACRHGA